MVSFRLAMKSHQLPKHWVIYGNAAGAVRTDGVEICRQHGADSALIVHRDNATLGDPHPRRFRRLNAAAAAADAAWPLKVDHTPAFRLVADPKDWRKPIDAVVSSDVLGAVVSAIHFFTGCDTIVAVEPDGRFRVRTMGVLNARSHRTPAFASHRSRRATNPKARRTA